MYEIKIFLGVYPFNSENGNSDRSQNNNNIVINVEEDVGEDVGDEESLPDLSYVPLSNRSSTNTDPPHRSDNDIVPALQDEEEEDNIQDEPEQDEENVDDDIQDDDQTTSTNNRSHCNSRFSAMAIVPGTQNLTYVEFTIFLVQREMRQNPVQLETVNGRLLASIALRDKPGSFRGKNLQQVSKYMKNMINK